MTTPERWATGPQWDRLIELKKQWLQGNAGGKDDGADGTGDKGPSKRPRNKPGGPKPKIIPGPGSGMI